MTDIDPAAVMAAHAKQMSPLCQPCRSPWPCEPYRLAEALAAEQTAHEGALVMLVDRNTELAAERAKVAQLESLRPLTRADVSHYCQHGSRAHMCICDISADHRLDQGCRR